MAREPFVWEVQLRQDVLDDAVAELRRLPYTVLCEIIKAPLRRTTVGRDNRQYRLTVTAHHVAGASEDIHVTIRLKRGWFGRTLRESFTVSPGNGIGGR
jgi:hypothetical protein